MTDLATLQAAVVDGRPVEDRRARRLLDALSDNGATASDLAPILRQVLRSAASDVLEPWLELPNGAHLAEVLGKADLLVERVGLHGLRVRAPNPAAVSWLDGRPEWIELATAAPGVAQTRTGEISTKSRMEHPVPSDPLFAAATGHKEHPVAAQREAVRAVALAPPGAVTHVALPTGAGKSLVGLLPTLLRREAQVVVIVPTVAIALDQQRAINEASGPGEIWSGAPRELAWYGGLGQETRARIRHRLLSGEQRVLFASPESVVASLEPTLLAAAQRGLLHTIVIDEAHLIAQWGLDFRPEMQLIASVREQLLEATSLGGHEPIRTVLLTATLDKNSFQLNRSLFSGTGATRIVGAPALRTEPRFLRHIPENASDLDARLVELLAVVPRPAIVYSTRKAEAERVTHVLRTAGYARVECFTGDTDSDSRSRILDDWRGTAGPSRLDVVVGTAAFGLGVDQADVRTVIHVEAPSSIGGYYQEVGRGGRDGHAAIAILLATRASLTTSLSIGDVTLLRDETIRRRWRALRTTLEPGTPDTVDVRVLPEHIARASDANELWNKNVLVLMERAGLIRLLPQPLPDKPDESAWEERRGRVALEVLQADLSPDAIAEAVQHIRTAHLEARSAERSAVAELLDGQTCYGKLFADAYSFEVDDGSGARVASRPVAACSGCPACCHKDLRAVDPPVAALPPAHLDRVEPSLKVLFANAPTLVLHDAPEWLEREGPSLMRKLIRSGCRQVFVERPSRRLEKAFVDGFVAVDPRPAGMFPFATPSVLWMPSSIDSGWRSSPGAPRIIVVDDTVVAPERRDQRLYEWWRPARQARDVMELL